jgi:hypothetical protein
MPALGLIPDPSDAIGRGQGQRGVKARNQARFLAAFEACGSVAKAARWAKVARTSHFEWMREDPTYRPRFIEAEKQAACGLEDEAVRRAREGVRKLVLYKGQPVYVHGEPLYETEYSDRLLERLLEANNPEKFKRRNETTFQWSGDPRELSPELLEKLEAHLIEAACGNDPRRIEEFRRELEAGPVIETTAEVVETRST